MLKSIGSADAGTFIPISAMGQPGGPAGPLDGSSQIPLSQIPLPEISSGTYTPSSLQSAVTPLPASYMRIGNVVSVAGSFNNPSSTPGSFVAQLSLPIASNITAVTQLNGVCTLENSSLETTAGLVEGHVLQDTANVTFRVPTNGPTQTVYYTYQYTIQ